MDAAPKPYVSTADPHDGRAIAQFRARNPACVVCGARTWEPGPLIAALSVPAPSGQPIPNVAAFVTMVCAECQGAVFVFTGMARGD